MRFVGLFLLGVLALVGWIVVEAKPLVRSVTGR